jgi:putative component of toxin-antitoxin plasmid stabilization module
VITKTARKFEGTEMKSPRSKKKLKVHGNKMEHIFNKQLKLVRTESTKVRDSQACLQIETRDSEVQVGQLRGASGVGTGLSVTRHDKAKNVRSCFLPTDEVFFTVSPFHRSSYWAICAALFTS